MKRRSFIKRTAAAVLGLTLFPGEIFPTLGQLRGGWKPRGLKNPIFSGEIGKYSGVTLYQEDRITIDQIRGGNNEWTNV
ncbi:hypothetical protein LCGC14_1020780 [marine sediment metagenome]|uniref:Twin-arginine translocation signal domain-containing protein n=1 Tax=marine sediment metagenome TaxID=412755 RepID=A0A0F9MXK0_9ZZZZ